MGQRNFELELQQQFGRGTKIHVDDAADRVTVELPDGNRHHISTEQARRMLVNPSVGPGSNQWAQRSTPPYGQRFFDPESLPTGTVIGWVMHGRFSYIAIKVEDRRRKQYLWYTSATDENTEVGQTLTDKELERLINTHPKISELAWADKWRTL